MLRNTVAQVPASFLSAVLSKAPSQGLTHTFYKYPARFSPEFARAAISTFSQPGDVILDPFMGSGTTLVEALVSGRHGIGSDINSLAYFISQVKTTPLSKDECADVALWIEGLQERLFLRGPRSARLQTFHKDAALHKGIPWPIRQTITLILAEVYQLPAKQRDIVQCALLKTGQWALDCTSSIPQVALFRKKFVTTVQEFLQGSNELWQKVEHLPGNAIPQIVCLNASASQLCSESWVHSISRKPTLIVTSPPYPNVHVLYHRWQIKSRKEVSTPYWIAGQQDGHGPSYYTMGNRSPTGLNNYFASIEETFTWLHHIVDNHSIVVQLLAFSDIEEQLQRYLDAMERAGFHECQVALENGEALDRIWREVPLRRWYASRKGNISSSREVVLIHQRV